MHSINRNDRKAHFKKLASAWHEAGNVLSAAVETAANNTNLEPAFIGVMTIRVSDTERAISWYMWDKLGEEHYESEQSLGSVSHTMVIRNTLEI